jgi:hypothetical protein
MMVKCKTCGHGCHCESDKIDSEHYTPLMDVCECKKCQHEVKEEIELIIAICLLAIFGGPAR